MKQPKCPYCGSKNVVLETDLTEFQFYIDEDGYVVFTERDVRDELYYCLEFRNVKCHCFNCHEDWKFSYED